MKCILSSVIVRMSEVLITKLSLVTTCTTVLAQKSFSELIRSHFQSSKVLGDGSRLAVRHFLPDFCSSCGNVVTNFSSIEVTVALTITSGEIQIPLGSNHLKGQSRKDLVLLENPMKVLVLIRNPSK